MLAARSLGYDSCPMIGFDAGAVAQLIGLPSDHLIGMLLTIGSATKPANPRGGLLPRQQVLLQNGFANTPESIAA